MKKLFYSALVASLLLSVPAYAVSEQESEIVLLRNTIENLLNAMVEEGLISREAAEQLIRESEEKADQEIEALTAEEEVQEGDVRVTYVPQAVVDEIAGEVSMSIEDQVTDQVVERAAAEGWGVPGALPRWIRRMRFSGDLRFRAQPIFFGSQNVQDTYPAYQRINEAGGAVNLEQQDIFLNTTEDTNAYLLRFRLGAEIGVGKSSLAAFRIATGNPDVPTSTNVLLSDVDRLNIELDRAYLRLNTSNERERNHWTLWLGRMPNPFMTTELVWDRDLSLSGAALGYDSRNRADLGGPRGLFAMAGAFPLERVDARLEDFGVEDKWLYGGQLGYEFGLGVGGSKLALATAWYKFDNYAGVKNTIPDSTATDASVPDWMTKGNSVFGVRETADPLEQVFGLAADFELFNVTAKYKWVVRPDFHVDIAADFVKNIGYDEAEIQQRTGETIPEKSIGWRAEMQVGAPIVVERWDWNAFGGWSYLERDATVDGFSQSNIHGGGTDYKGFYVGGSLGVAEDVWLRTRWLSTDQIDEPTLAIDTLQLDINTRF